MRGRACVGVPHERDDRQQHIGPPVAVLLPVPADLARACAEARATRGTPAAPRAHGRAGEHGAGDRTSSTCRRSCAMRRRSSRLSISICFSPMPRVRPPACRSTGAARPPSGPAPPSQGPASPTGSEREPRRAHSASTCASAGAAGSPVAQERPGRLARARSRAVKRGRRGRRRGLAERAHLQLPLLGLCGLREDVDDERSPVSHAAGRQLLRRPSTASASGRGSGRRCRSGAPSPSPGCAAARGSARRQRSLRTPARWSRAGSAAAQELWRQPPLHACVGLQLGQLGRQLRKLASAQVCPLQGARPVSCSPARPMRRHHK